jgi:hypothetical protein
MNLARQISILLLAAAASAGMARAQQEPPPPPNGGLPADRVARDGFPVGPPAKILSFTANSQAIQPGDSVTLKWAVINADKITIDHGIGVVAARGSRSLTPKSTTTYHMSAVGYGNAGNSAESVTITVAGTTAAPDARTEAAAPQPVPRTADGHPDLSGIFIAPYTTIHAVVPAKLKPGAESFHVGTDWGFNLTEHCLPPGVPGITEWPYPFRFVQQPGLVVILYEGDHFFRIIPTDGSTHPDDLDPTWMGNSVGHWDGDTLVVDVTGFNDKGYVEDYRHTTALHVVERYRRVSYDTMSYEATIDDPNVWQAPWTIVGTLNLHPEWQIQEYVCEDNNKDYKSLFDPHQNSSNPGGQAATK